ncbi:MAG: endopeptidase La [bacterium]|nr:endopeptidase La [bacterium]
MIHHRLTEDAEDLKLPDVLPVLPLKDAVIFPYIIMPLSLGSDRSVQAVDHALASDRLVMLVAQKDPDQEEPEPSQLHAIGTVGMIMRMLKLPDGRIRVLVQGLVRARLEHMSRTEPFLQARIEHPDASVFPLPDSEDPPREAPVLETTALIRSVRENLEKAVHLGRNLSPEVMVVASSLDDPGRLADLVASNLDLKMEEAQNLLGEIDPLARLRTVSEHLHREIVLLTMQHEISSQARGEMDRSQHEYYLRQQLKAIRQELGEVDDFRAEIDSYRRTAEEGELPAEAREELEKQLQRLERSHPDSAETTVIRTYLDWLTGLPWSKVSCDHLDLEHASEVLNEDHYDLEKVKERILEFLAVRKLKADTKGPILCFVGPPGVGKTSLGRSIARALDRRFVGLSLGGVHDEAEIRGHRRTYVGAMPGRIIQGIHQAGTSNPVFMIDEIDKIGADYRGDPSSALLEVLDPEQNSSFRDHYLGVPYDLSRVIFITTANLLDPIQPAFLDRMEVIRLSGYTEEEKLAIAHRHLIPKQLEENGISAANLRFTESGLRKVIRGYTREAGLRNFEREIAALCRKVAVRVAKGRVAKGRTARVWVKADRVGRLLGPEKHFNEALLDHDRVGVATGLAWTAAGGDLLLIEVVAVPGKGELLLTGRLGEVMKESAQAALSYARAFASANGYGNDFFSTHDIHVHAPAGSIPKDGPSAGITIATAVISVLTAVAVNRTVAMTGEITLRGEILPIGGLKEKALAARAAGITTVIVPRLNERDLEEIPATLRKGLTFRFLGHMNEVLESALTRKVLRSPEPNAATAGETTKAQAAAPGVVSSASYHK